MTTEAKVNAGRAAERLLREPGPRLCQPNLPMQMPRKPRKVTSSSERALTPEPKIGQPRWWNCLSRLSRRILLQGRSRDLKEWPI
jgi:hypothetical protein